MSNAVLARDYYGNALLEAGREDPRIVALDADLQACTRTDQFAAAFPERYFNVGIAEANMVGIAAGLASCGKKPFVNSFAMFISGRAFEQIRNSVCYPNLDVKFVGTHAGVTVGKDGATHECIEDLACMRAIPNMTVLCPADANEAFLITKEMARMTGPAYMRLSRLEYDEITNVTPGYEFHFGRASWLCRGTDVALIGTGLLVPECRKAKEILAAEGIQAAVIDIHCIKPLDEEAVIEAARTCGAIVTAEAASILGGLGDAVASAVCAHVPVPVLKTGVEDRFGRSGNPLELMEYYHLTAPYIAEKARLAVRMKR